MICPGSPRTRQRTQAESAPSGCGEHSRGAKAWRSLWGCVYNHCPTPPQPQGSRQRYRGPVGSQQSPNGFPKPRCQERAGRQHTPVFPATEEPRAGAGVAHSGRIQGWEGRSGVVPGPTEWWPTTAVSTDGLDISEKSSRHGETGRDLGLKASLRGTAR